jgi:hypothetical protein
MKLIKIVRLDENTMGLDLDSEAGMEEWHRIKTVQRDGNNISSIDDPSELVQLAAVEQNPYSIQHIDHPTEKVQLYVVHKNGMYVTMIDNPLPNVVIIALKDPNCYEYAFMYEKFVKHQFKNNTLLMKKWLRYGEAMRNQNEIE